MPIYIDELKEYISTLNTITSDKAIIRLNEYLGRNIDKIEIEQKQNISISQLANKFPVTWTHKNDNKYLAPLFTNEQYINYLTTISNTYKRLPIPNYAPLFKLSDLPNFNENWCMITVEEFNDTVMNRQTNGKDMYNFSYESLKIIVKNCPFISEFIVRGYNDILQNNYDLCEEFCSATIHTSFKGGSREDVKRFRPICVLPILVRMMDCILSSKLHNIILEYNIIDTRVQKAVLKQFNGLWENIFDINMKLNEMMKEKDNENIFLFIDLANAYGSVNYRTMLFILKSYNFSPQLTAYFERYYKNIFGIYKNTSFKWNNGLFQGTAFSFILFLIYIDFVMKNIFQDLKATNLIQIDYDLQENSFAFVDDIAMRLPYKSGIHMQLNLINKILKFYGFSINTDKTYFVICDSSINVLEIDGISYKKAGKDFLYLGQSLFIYEDEVFKNIQSNLQRCLIEIDSYNINNKIKAYIYYTKIFQRISHILEMYYIIQGNTKNIEIVMNEISYFMYRWDIENYENYQKIHLEYIGKKGSNKLLKSPNLKKYLKTITPLTYENEIKYLDIFGMETPDFEDIEENFNLFKKSCLFSTESNEADSDFYSNVLA